MSLRTRPSATRSPPTSSPGSTRRSARQRPSQAVTERGRWCIESYRANAVMPTQAAQVAILTPLAVGILTVLCTIVIHAVALGATVNLVRHETRFGRAGASYGSDFAI